MTIRIPRFRPHTTPVIRPSEGVLLLSETRPRVLHGALYAQVAAMIDGLRDSDSIVSALAGRVEASHVHYALILLEKAGHIVDASAPGGPQAAYWSELGRDAPTGHVRLHAFGAACPTPMAEALGRLGIATTDSALETHGAGSLDVAVTDDHLHPDLDALAEASIAAGRRLLLLRPIGFELWIGPLLAADTPPLSALTQRLALNDPWRLLVPKGGARATATRAALPSTVRIASEIAATEIAKLLAGEPSPLHGAVLSIDTLSWTSRLHPLVPLAATAARDPRITLRDCHVTNSTDGGHRAAAPEQTVARFEHLVSPITGIVSDLRLSSSPADAFPVYESGINQAAGALTLADTRKSLRARAGGKGASHAQARASALCEALERASAVFRGDEPRQAASFVQMNARHGDAVIHPARLMHFSAQQYAERDAWNARGSRFNRVPESLPDDAVIDWSAAWSLTHGAVRYLPTQLLHLAAPAGPGDDTRYSIGCSNGHAAGNTLEEAILQGLFEVIERDAVAIWWYNRLRRPGVDPLAFGDALSGQVVAQTEAAGRRLWALDITSDLGIPTFCAVSTLADAAGSRPMFGFGCHIDARIALQRALAEARQMIVGIDGIETAPDARGEVVDWLTQANRATEPYLWPDAEAPRAPMARVMPSGELRRDIEACRDMLATHGLEMLVMDQTRADIGLPVAKVVVPGLRHFWARYAPGRLYDVPVSLGWLPGPLTECELNPTPMFI
jgi:ribosomal protein S12 methylthiotransferase accessory factor